MLPPKSRLEEPNRNITFVKPMIATRRYVVSPADHPRQECAFAAPYGPQLPRLGTRIGFVSNAASQGNQGDAAFGMILGDATALAGPDTIYRLIR